MGQFVGIVFSQPQIIPADSVADIPAEPVFYPAVEPFLVGSRLDEEFHLHLLKLASAEGEIAGGNLVAKGLAYLPNTKGELFSGGIQHVLEIDEYSLGSFRAQKHLVTGVLHRTHEGAEHEVEAAGFSEFATALGTNRRFQLVGPKPEVALAAFHQGVRKVLDVAAGNPDLGRHQNGGIQSYHVVPADYYGLPPGFLDVCVSARPPGVRSPRLTPARHKSRCSEIRTHVAWKGT